MMAMVKLFLKSFFINTFQNEKNMQNFGFVYALKDVLKKTTSGAKEYYERLSSYFEYVSSNPFFATAIIGLCVNLEKKKKSDMIGKLKIEAMSPIAALADAIVWGTLKPCLTLILGALALMMVSASPLVFWLVFFVITNVFRWYNLFLSEKLGLGFVFTLSRFNLQAVMIILKRVSMIFFGGFSILFFEFQFNVTPMFFKGSEHVLLIGYFAVATLILNKMKNEFSFLLFLGIFTGYYYFTY